MPSSPNKSAGRTWPGALRLGAWVIVLGTLFLTLRYDVNLMQWRNRAMGEEVQGWSEQVRAGFRNFGQVLTVVVVIIVVATYDRRRRRIIAAILFAQLLAMIAYNGGKFLIARDRPYAAMSSSPDLATVTAGDTWKGWQPKWRPMATQSFPSGHSAAAFALAGVLAAFYRRLGWMFWTLAAGCAVSRYLDAMHWPSDCVAGAAIGYLAAWLALRVVGARRAE